ncbi:MAG: AAA family ATPase [Myxococcota bacterium]|jgi:hypothetical protein|nr:AAA family ATPase [Myxococcota bacterium]
MTERVAGPGRVGSEITEPLPEGLVEGLEIGRADGEPPPAHIQTHISHLFLTRDRVYKIRKAVHFPFLSFATRAERNQDCLDEVRLNRRLAEDVYLGVSPLQRRGDDWGVGEVREDIPPQDEGLEHCVVMRRLRDDCDGQSLLERGELSPAHIDATAERVAAFHASHGLGSPAPWDAGEWRSRIEAPVLESLDLIEEHAPDEPTATRARALRVRFDEVFEARAGDIEQRRLEGRAVDGHGDLQLAHIWFDGDDTTPSIIDCTEFNEDFRKIDTASEVAFTAMDLTYRGAPELAERFLARYAEASGDFGLYTLVDPYAAYRSAVRAKVALLATVDAEITPDQRAAAQESAERHLGLAEGFLKPRPAGWVAITCGTVGSGKSSVAREFAAACGGVVISSDRTRKQLAGMRPDDHSEAGGPPNQGLYATDRTAAVYEALLEGAASVSEGGRIAVLDASFTTAYQREAVREWAARSGVEVVLLEVQCAKDEALARLAARESSGTDASDAGPEFLAYSLEHFEPPSEWPRESRVVIATDEPDWRDAASDAARARVQAWRDGTAND